MSGQKMKMNPLPVPTWNRLDVNESEAPKPTGCGGGLLAEKIPEGISRTGAVRPDRYALLSDVFGTEYKEVCEQAKEGSEILSYRADRTGEPLFLTVSYAKEHGRNGEISDVKRFFMEAAEGETFTVFMDFTAEQPGNALVQTLLYAEKNAVIRLVQLQRTGKELEFSEHVAGYCAEGASIELVQLFLGEASTWAGGHFLLQGNESRFRMYNGYALEGNRLLDMNYVVKHAGKNTECNLMSAGSLNAGSVKVFRGTIDFLKGCSGSVGAEKEEILLMDDGVVNKTVPLILCGEEDVEGSHGASVGRPDEEILFYMTSRGISESEAYEMLRRAKLDAALGEIKDPQIAEAVGRAIDEYFG